MDRWLVGIDLDFGVGTDAQGVKVRRAFSDVALGETFHRRLHSVRHDVDEFGIVPCDDVQSVTNLLRDGILVPYPSVLVVPVLPECQRADSAHAEPD